MKQTIKRKRLKQEHKTTNAKRESLYKANTNNKIDKIINLSGKSIIFTDYKTIKKYKKSYSTINSYEYYKDINFLLALYIEGNHKRGASLTFDLFQNLHDANDHH